MADGQLTIYIPDQAPISVPDNGQSVEELRRALIAAGYAALETATGRKDGSTVRFERPVGGQKGF